MNDAENKSRYGIEQSIAKGGMGEVLEARDLHFGRAVAMKVIRADRDPSREMRLRFVQEARILSQLEHPNIVPVYDLDKDEQGRVFYTMKKVQGVTLKEVINQLKTGDAQTVAKYSLTQLLTVFQKVCDAVAFAHSKGIVHRDLKPENVMVGEYGEVLVLDWGLAKILSDGSSRGDEAPSNAERGMQNAEGSAGVSPEGTPPHPALSPAGGEGARRAGEGESSGSSLPDGFHELDQMPRDAALTLEGQIMGTPQFMAPEQAEGRINDIDERTDIFSLGGILYSLLTLRPPTGGTTVKEVLANVKSGYIAPPTIYNKSRKRSADGTELESAIDLVHCPGGSIPDSLSAVAMKAMALVPEARYQTVPEFQAEISAYQGGFATTAEQAGAFKQLWLLILRHKTVSGVSAVAVAIVLVLGTGLGIKITQERNRANATLTDLRRAVPLMRAEIDGLIAAHKFADALPKAEYVCSLLPENAEAFVLKGNLFQSLFRFEEAGIAYRHALALNSQHAVARENLALCRELRSKAGSKLRLSDQGQQELLAALNRQGRFAEAAALLQFVGQGRNKLLQDWKTKVEAARPSIGAIQGFSMGEDGRLNITLVDVARPDLSPLEGLPIAVLNVSGKALRDIAALKGAPLVWLNLTKTSVSDMSPLKGMPLKSFGIQYSPVSDLTPLLGMPLEEANLQSNVNLRDISPLQGMRLKSLFLNGCPVADLSLVRGMQLNRLEFTSTKVRSLKPLRGLKLEALEFGSEMDSDLSPLRGMPLTNLMIQCQSVRDITPLQGMPLQRLVMGLMQVDDLHPLQGMRLAILDARRTKVRDLKPLTGMPLEVLCLSQCPISDLTPLRGMPLRELRLDGCDLVMDLAPLADCRELERLTIPMYARNGERLRTLPKLKKLAYSLPDEDWNKIPPVLEFWTVYDARKGKK